MTADSEIRNPKPPLPGRILYATSAGIGGSGLDAVARETLHAAEEAGLRGTAICFDSHGATFAGERIHSLKWHPTRLLSWIVGRPFYYGAKKHAVDRAAADLISRGHFDLFHGWSGEAVRTLRQTRKRGLPSIIEIPTWHRHKGKPKPDRLTKSERERAAARGFAGWKNGLLVSRQQMLEEYALADLLLVLSAKAEETFLSAGIPANRLFRHQRGVDVERFLPAANLPQTFRAIFVGALIERKGVHRLLEAWARLDLRDAELALVGSMHPEMEPWLRRCAGANVKLCGFVPNVHDYYRAATVHIFPSLCEGSAKATYEAAACGLPQITTRESGDVVQDNLNGLIVPPDDVEALAAAIKRLHADRALCIRLGAAGRRRVVEHFTWGHFRARLMEAYRIAFSRKNAEETTVSESSS